MRTENTYLKLILMLSVLGLLVAGWLLSIHIKFSTGQAGLTEGCGVAASFLGNGCENVAVSKYSDIFGLPLAAIAMGYYFSLILLVFWAIRNYQASFESIYVSYFLSTLAIIVTVAMFCIARFVLKSFCIGCSILWLVNLAIWPCFVKHLGLNWGNALAGNLELFRHKDLKLRSDRRNASFGAALLCVLVFAALGASAKSLSTQEGRTEESSIVNDYKEAKQMFLPAEAIGGPQAKGAIEAKAPVLDIIEFADFQCPGCKMASQFLKPFVMKHHDQVRVTFRNFPLDGSCNPLVPNGMHHVACNAATAAICSGRQGKFWDMHDLIYDNQENISSGMIDEFVGKIGLDKASFTSCITDAELKTQLQKEIAWGDQIQLESTPTLIINGRKMVGARSPSDLETLFKYVENGGK